MESETASMQGKTAMVVDDGAVERMAGKALLQKLGFSVREAENGEEALRLLETHPADIVLCDISMPGMSGMALLEATRKWPSPPLFIMCTSHDDMEHAVASLQSGASAYVPKPLRFDVLKQVVSDALARNQ